MKICHVTSSLRMGGAEAVLYALVKELHGRGHAQHVLALHDGPYKLLLKNIPVSVKFFSYFTIHYIYFFLKNNRPHVVHSQLWYANLWVRIICWWLKIPCVTVLHNNPQQNGTVRTIIDRICARVPATIVSVSPQVAQSAHAYRIIPASKTIAVIENGVTVNPHFSNITRAGLGIPEDAFVVGAVGRFVPLKRFDRIIAAAAHCMTQDSNIWLVILGVGKGENNVRTEIERTGVSNHTIVITGQWATQYYPLFDCFMSASDYDGISMALLDAMVHGCVPIVCSMDGSHPVIEHGNNGIVISPPSIEGLAAACLTIKEEPERAQLYRECAKQTVSDRFSMVKMVDAYERLFCQRSMQ